MSKPVGPYSPAIHAGDFLMISGQIGHVEGVLVDGGLNAEAPKALENLKKLVELEGTSLNQVVKTTVFLTDMDDYVRMNEIYCSVFDEHRPARSAVAVAALPLGACIEIEAIVYKG
jgi:2-iminobutanoate/2-iminopropanoate deaminase